MKPWQWTTLLLCAYGFWKGFIPSVHYLTDYLVGPPPLLTPIQIYSRVYPIWTYSYMCLLAVVLFLADILRYKPLIIVESVALIVTYTVLAWGSGLGLMQLMQVTYGIASSCEVGYYSYIYAKVKVEKYKKVTSWTRCAVLLGKFASGVSAQVLVSLSIVNLRQLVYISLGSVCGCFLVALFLPAVDANSRNPATDVPMQELRKRTTELLEQPVVMDPSFAALIKSVVVDYKTNKYVFKWSVWWAMASCGTYLVGNYIQLLWNDIRPSESNGADLYNGAVDAIKTLLGAGVSLYMQYVKVDFNRWGEGILLLVSCIQAATLIIASMTTSIWICYGAFVLHRVLYDMLITIVSFQLAKNIQKDTYGMVFGINTFVSLLLQTVITLLLVDEACFAATPRTQFLFYGCYHAVIGFVFLSTMTYSFVVKWQLNEIIV